MNRMRILRITLSVLILFSFANCFNSRQDRSGTIDTISSKSEAGNTDSASSNTYDAKFTLQEISQIEYENLISKVVPRPMDTSVRVQKSNGELRLTIDKGSERIFRDTLSESDNADKRVYSYSGSFELARLYVVFAKYYGSAEYILVRKENGASATLWDKPLLSPNAKLIATASASLGYTMYNGIQIFFITNDSIELLLETEFSEFEPHDLRWISNTLLVFKQVYPADDEVRRKEKVSYAKMTISGG